MANTILPMPIQTQALLVGITFGLPRQSRKLIDEAAKVEQENHAAKGTVRASLHYFKRRDGKNDIDGLAPIKSFQNEWKAALNAFARYPFAEGLRLLPAKLAEAFMAKNAEFESRKGDVFTQWLTLEYPTWAESAPTRMGHLYSEQDFPSALDCTQRFKCEVTYLPMPAAEQIRQVALINPSLTEEFERTTNERISAAVSEARSKVREDVLTPITKIVEVLSKDKPKIFDTLITNLTDVLAVAPAYNFDNDGEFTSLIEQAKTTLATVNADDLRESEQAKKQTLQAAKALVSQFGQMGQRRFAA